MAGKAIYLDNQSTTPLDPRVLEAMMPYLTEHFGNPHSHGHKIGWKAREAVNDAREQVAYLVNSDVDEIYFTSGATESCNLALQGIAQGNEDKSRNKIITVATEHSCVIETCKMLERKGYEVKFLPVTSCGLLELGVVEEAVDDATLLVSVMLANNEIGVIQPLVEIGEICRRHGAIFHSDATQGVGKNAVDVDDLGLDLASFSAHKYYGPKGVGALYVRKNAKPRLEPMLFGGDQERGLRSGTVPTFLAVGIGEASEIAQSELEKDQAHTKELAERLYRGLAERIPNIILIGHPTRRLPGNLSLSLPGILGTDLVSSLGESIALSAGSACYSTIVEASHVINALKMDETVANGVVRVSIGRFNTEAEVDQAVSLISAKCLA